MSSLMILLQVVTVADSAQVAQSAQVATSITIDGFVDIAYKLSMVAIALKAAFYTICTGRKGS